MPKGDCTTGTDIVDLQRIHGLLEFGHGIARVEPAQIAALGGRTVLRVRRACSAKSMPLAMRSRTFSSLRRASGFYDDLR